MIHSTHQLIRNGAMAMSTALLVSACATFTGPENNLEEALNAEDPMTFVEGYVEHVQPGTEWDVYAQFLHPAKADGLNHMSKFRDAYLDRAQLENQAIATHDMLSTAEVQSLDLMANYDLPEYATVTLQLPEGAEPIDGRTVYDERESYRQGKTLTTGKISIAKENGRWYIAEHILN